MSARTVFRDQPKDVQFANVLVAEVAGGRWQALEVGVAWARRSGVRLVRRSLVRFLRRGGVLRITVGIDIENTSKEGLAGLLSLEQYGVSEIFVYHNEESGVTFHPKVYLFRNSSQVRLIVGSNNLTEGGLWS